MKSFLLISLVLGALTSLPSRADNEFSLPPLYTCEAVNNRGVRFLSDDVQVQTTVLCSVPSEEMNACSTFSSLTANAILKCVSQSARPSSCRVTGCTQNAQ